MTRILLRSGKSPFEAADPARYIHQDLMGTNVGNLLFSDAVHKLLSLPGTEVVSNGIRTTRFTPEWVERTNAEFDVFAVPLANAFRPTFHASLDRLTAAIEQLTIPVVVIGVGAQAGIHDDLDVLAGMKDSVVRFARAVLERSASIGVRGELTERYLNGLGFHEVDVIGCPSAFTFGPEVPELKSVGEFGAQTRVALNLSPDARLAGDVSGLARVTLDRHPLTTYFAQEIGDARLLFWGDTSVEEELEDAFPLHLSHRLLREGRTLVPLDPHVWRKDLARHDVALGTRIHGNIAGLLAGIPSVVVAHDSRTLELSRYFDIPHVLMESVPAGAGPAEVFEGADFTAWRGGHRERYDRLASFLERNGLPNAYAGGDDGAAFEADLGQVALPESLRLWDGHDDGHLRYRISELRNRSQKNKSAADKKIATLTSQLATTKKALESAKREGNQLRESLGAATERLDETEARLGALEEQSQRLGARVSGIDTRLLVRVEPALKRRLRRLKGGSG